MGGGFGEVHHPQRFFPESGVLLKTKNPLRHSPEGAESGLLSLASRCARYGHGNSYDHGCDVGGGFIGRGGGENHVLELKTRDVAGVKRGFEFGSRGPGSEGGGDFMVVTRLQGDLSQCGALGLIIFVEADSSWKKQFGTFPAPFSDGDELERDAPVAP